MVSIAVESWIWYGFATAVLLTRIVWRLTADDWTMLVVLAFYTVEVAALNIVDRSNTNLLPPGYLDTHPLTDDDIRSLSLGSKWVVVVEQCQCSTIWLVKGCFLMMMHRVTQRAYETQHFLVELLIGYVVITFFVMECLYFLAWCQPFHYYWAVPTPNIQCSTATNHLIVNAAFNLSSDLAVLCIALPMFIRSHLPLQRKLTLCAIFSLGIFVIICAALNKYYSFSNPFGREWENWYVREASTAILVANLPFTWGFVRRFIRGPDNRCGQPPGLAFAVNSTPELHTDPAIVGRPAHTDQRARTNSSMRSALTGHKLNRMRSNVSGASTTSDDDALPHSIRLHTGHAAHRNFIDLSSAFPDDAVEEYESVLSHSPLPVSRV